MDQNPTTPPTVTPDEIQSVPSSPVVPTPPVPENVTNNPLTNMPETTSNLNVPKNNKRKKFIIIGIIVFSLLLVGSASAAAYLLNKKDQATTESSVTSLNKDIKTKDKDSNVIANCLKSEDYSAVRDKESLPEYYDETSKSTSVSETIFFKPNSINYEYLNENEVFDKYAEFYRLNKAKSWVFELQGQIKDVDGSGNSPANKKLANDRAQKIKTELVSRGFDVSRIIILEPEVYSAEFGADDSDRNVSMNLKSQCIKDQEYN